MELDDAELRDRVAGLQRGFTPPPELVGSRPRDVELTGGGRALYVVAMALFALAVVVVMLLGHERRKETADQQAFDTRGVLNTARVERLWRTSDDSKQSWVAYRYDVGGSAYEGRSKIRLADWRALHEGSTLAIRHLSDEPSRSRLTSVSPRSIPAWLPIVVGLGITIPPILLLVVINGQRRLLAEGRPAPALVTKVAKYQSTHGGSHRSIRYAFPLLTGSMATGRSDARKGQVIGSVICIVYDPDRPQRSVPYPFALVRPAKLAR